MQTVSRTYTALWRAGAKKETRAIIGGATYTEANIVSAGASAALMDKAATVGNCTAKELNMVLYNPSAIPRMAEIQMQIRLTDGVTVSEWVPKGTFYIDTRQQNGERLEITAYDAMLKTEQNYYNTSGNQGQWPKTDIAVVNEICQRIGVTLDPRTQAILTKGYHVQYPGFGEGGYTIHDVLGFIGSMYAGNWVITDEDKLRLVVLGEMPPDTNYLVTEQGEPIVMGGVRLIVG